jgi:hypothetical protein
MAIALAQVPTRRRSGPEAPWGPPAPARPRVPSPAPRRPFSESEPDPRCRPARPTRAGCRPGGRKARPGAAVRRRRVLLGTLAVGLLAALALPWSGTGGSLATPGPALAGEIVAHHSPYVVRPGDTLWSIAARLDPTGDPRPVVAQLSAQVGRKTVAPGEQLVLP